MIQYMKGHARGLLYKYFTKEYDNMYSDDRSNMRDSYGRDSYGRDRDRNSRGPYR